MYIHTYFHTNIRARAQSGVCKPCACQLNKKNCRTPSTCIKTGELTCICVCVCVYISVSISLCVRAMCLSAEQNTTSKRHLPVPKHVRVRVCMNMCAYVYVRV